MRLPDLIAVVAPVAVLGAGIAALLVLADPKTAKNMTNAGNVVNGVVYAIPAVEAIEGIVDDTPPDVVVLGNSYANTNVRIDDLAAAAGGATVKLTIPNTVGTHWYAVLDNRLFQRGLSPRLVIAFSDIQSALLVQPADEASVVNLEVELDGDDPVIDARVARGNPWWIRARTNRVMARDALLAGIRDAGARWTSRLAGIDASPTVVLSALDRVLGDGATDPRLRDVAPLAGTVRAVDLVDPDTVPAPADSMLPALADLCRAHGATLVVVRSPMSPEIQSAREIRDGTIDALYDVLTAHGAALIDLSPLPMRAGHYELNAHMTEEGADRTTRTLIRALDALGLIDAPGPAGAEVLGGLRVERGVVALTPAALAFEAPPPSLDPSGPVVGSGPTGRIAAPELAGVAADRAVQVTPFAARCSPVRVLEDGAPLPLPNARCDEVRRFRGGRTCHVAQGIEFATVDGTAPADNGRTYQLGLTDDRRCDNSTWMYPGDRFAIDVLPSELARLQAPATTAWIGFRSTLPATELRVRIVAEGVTVGDGKVTAGDDGWARLALDPPVPVGAGAVTVRVGHPGRGLVLVTRAVLE
ncbi:MAG: hypothetical protein ABMB14_07900 [Myxococcota bacterium]